MPQVDGEGDEESHAEAEQSPPPRQGILQLDGECGEKSLDEAELSPPKVNESHLQPLIDQQLKEMHESLNLFVKKKYS